MLDILTFVYFLSNVHVSVFLSNRSFLPLYDTEAEKRGPKTTLKQKPQESGVGTNGFTSTLSGSW